MQWRSFFIRSSYCVSSSINALFLPYAQSVASVPAWQYVGSSQAPSLAYRQLSSPELVVVVVVVVDPVRHEAPHTLATLPPAPLMQHAEHP